MPRSTRRILPAAAAVWLIGLAVYPLLESTEGRYASVAWTMAHGGSWIEPRFGGAPLFTKPPLAYWAGAGALTILPDATWSVRLPATLMLLCCVWLTWRLALIVGLDEARARGSALMAGLSPLAVAQGHMTTGDIFLWAGVLIAFTGLLSPSLGRLTRAVGVGLGLALGFLAKGQMVLFWIVLPLLIWSLVPGGDRRCWRRLVHPQTIGVFLVLAAPWFVVVLHRYPDLLGYWLGSEVRDRLLTATHSRSEPWWYFLPQVPLLMLPWLSEWWRGLRRSRIGRDYHILLLAWVLGPLLVFSFSGSKRPNYLLPMVTPLALLAGQGWPAHPGRWLRWRAGIWVVIVLAWPFALALGPWGPPTRDLAAAATGGGHSLVAYRAQPSSLTFYQRQDVPLIGSAQTGSAPGGHAPAAPVVVSLKNHLDAGGWVLLRKTDLTGLRSLLKQPLSVRLKRGRWLLVSGDRPESDTCSLSSPMSANGRVGLDDVQGAMMTNSF